MPVNGEHEKGDGRTKKPGRLVQESICEVSQRIFNTGKCLPHGSSSFINGMPEY